MDTVLISPESFEMAHYKAVCRLLRQLTTRDVVLSEEGYNELVASPSSKLFLLLRDDEVVGMLTVGMYASPTGTKAWIEDVVVDEAMRGRSIGRLLVNSAIEYAKTLGGGTLMLTSRPSREAANALYRSCGFVFKETNNYKMEITAE